MPAEAWEFDNQRWGDTPKSHQALMVYLQLGVDRSLAKAAQALGKSTALLERWSRAHSWDTRKEAYDSHQRKLKQQQIEQMSQEVHRAKIETYRASQEKAHSELIELGMIGAEMAREMADLAKATDNPNLKTRYYASFTGLIRALPSLFEGGAAIGSRSLGIDTLMAHLEEISND